MDAAHDLVDQHGGVARAVALALGTAGQQHGTHAGGLAEAYRRHVGLDELHGVVDGHSIEDGTAGGVYVKIDVLVGVFPAEVEQLGNDGVGHVIIDGSSQIDDAGLQEQGVGIEGAFAFGGGSDNPGQDVAGEHAFRGIRKLQHR